LAILLIQIFSYRLIKLFYNVVFSRGAYALVDAGQWAEILGSITFIYLFFTRWSMGHSLEGKTWIRIWFMVYEVTYFAKIKILLGGR